MIRTFPSTIIAIKEKQKQQQNEILRQNDDDDDYSNVAILHDDDWIRAGTRRRGDSHNGPQQSSSNVKIGSTSSLDGLADYCGGNRHVGFVARPGSCRDTVVFVAGGGG